MNRPKLGFHTLFDMAAIGFIVGGLYQVNPARSVPTGVIVLVVIFASDRLFGFAVAQVSTVIVAVSYPRIEPFLLAEFGSLIMLFTPLLMRADRARYTFVTILGLSIISALAFATVQTTGSTSMGAVVVGIVVTVISYGLHRYEMLVLGLVPNE